MPTLQTQHSPRFAPEGQEQACTPEDTQEDVLGVLLRIIKNWMTKMSVKGPSQKGLKDLKSQKSRRTKARQCALTTTGLLCS